MKKVIDEEDFNVKGEEVRGLMYDGKLMSDQLKKLLDETQEIDG